MRLAAYLDGLPREGLQQVSVPRVRELPALIQDMEEIAALRPKGVVISTR